MRSLSNGYKNALFLSNQSYLFSISHTKLVDIDEKPMDRPSYFTFFKQWYPSSNYSEILTLRWICNPPAWNLSIFNAIFGLQILTFNASGLQIPTNITLLVDSLNRLLPPCFFLVKCRKTKAISPGPFTCHLLCQMP